MANVHRSIPLRRIVRSRPLTDEEVARIYGRSDRESRPATPARGDDRPLSYPPVAHVEEDDLYELPVRRRRLWPVVVLALAGAGALLAYAVVRNDDAIASKLGIAAPAAAEIDHGLDVDRDPIEVGPTLVAMEALGEPNVGAGEPAAAALRMRGAPVPPRQQSPVLEQEPPLRATPYPEVERSDLDDLKRDLDEQLGVRGEQEPILESPSPEQAPPRSDNPYEAPAPDQEIIRDPGF
jgi:hypothetical protein